MKPIRTLLSSLLFLTFLFLSSALIFSPPPSQPPSQPPSAACKSTPYPKLCRAILSAFKNSPSDPYNYGKFTIKQCLKQAEKLSKIIDGLLVKSKQRSKMSHVELGAMSDCGDLLELNVDYLTTTSSELKAVELMSDELIDRVTSYLSAVVTNQHTCFDGLVEAKSEFVSVLSEPIANVGQLYSVSLGLVTQALKRKSKRSKHDFAPKPNPAREPLDILIKTLRNSCKKSNGCKNGKRFLDELNSGSDNGILINNTVIVGEYDTDNFTTITEAIEFAPNKTNPEDGYFVIYAREGSYEEYITISKYKRNIILIGDGINKTIITGNHSFVDGWSTFNSSTFAVSGERFVAIDMTFRNTAGPEKHQAVAVRNNAETSTFYRCSFEGYQDTLYVHSLRQFYKECDIYGTVDFIFGNAAVVFQNCNLYARKPMPQQKNAFTAQGRTDPGQTTGIAIQNCTVKAAPDLASELNSTLSYLGRPWKLYSRTVYMQSYIDDVISPVGWLEWNGTTGLDTLYYGEFMNVGPGSNTSARVNWPGFNLMNATDALNFTVSNFTMGYAWLPDVDIPFSGGLLE